MRWWLSETTYSSDVSVKIKRALYAPLFQSRANALQRGNRVAQSLHAVTQRLELTAFLHLRL